MPATPPKSFGRQTTTCPPGKDLDFALGIIRNNRDGDTQATQITMGVTWRFK